MPCGHDTLDFCGGGIITVAEEAAPSATSEEVIGNNILKDTAFSDIATTWTLYDNANDGLWAGTKSTTTGDGKGNIIFDISDLGFQEWGLQFSQEVQLTANKKYMVSFDVKSDFEVAKKLKTKLDAGEDMLDVDIPIDPGETVHFQKTFAATEYTGKFMLIPGFLPGDTANSAGKLTISNVQLIEEANSILRDTAFTDVTASEDSEWTAYAETWGDLEGNVTADGSGNLFIDYTRIGSAVNDGTVWAIQITQHNVSLEDGKKYRLYFKADSDMTAAKKLKVKFDAGESMLNDDFTVVPGETHVFDKTFDGADFNGNFLFAAGLMEGDTAGSSGKITISDLVLYEVVDLDTPGPVIPELEDPEDYNGRTIEEMEADGWNLLWNDEFDGETLDTDKWDYQLGNGTLYGLEDGWNNWEAEYYQKENVTVDSGKLTLIAKSEEVAGKHFTSGRIRTVTDDGEVKFASTYGRFEASIQLPAVSGAWPAFWLVPVSSDIYGGWPVSGEIDIMEARGNDPSSICGTMHYGTPGQLYKGANYTFDTDVTNFTGYHLYAVEWEPGVVRWYVDDKLFCTSDSWESKASGASDSFAFGAPYDAPFYIILNLAVGGTFGAGTPKPEDYAQGAEMNVDYVRVYQKYANSTEYNDANVTPAQGGPDVNFFNKYYGDYQEGDSLIPEDNFASLEKVSAVDPTLDSWQFYTGAEFGASATADTLEKDGTTYAHANITNVGNQIHSVQLIKHFPLAKNYYYKVSFDAYADHERTIVVKPAGDDDNDWTPYHSETIGIGTEPKNCSFTFLMDHVSDPSARLEFNLGGVATGDVYIGNVKVEVLENPPEEEEETTKAELSDGNHLWNGSFDQGARRLGNWEWTDDITATVPVRENISDVDSVSDVMVDEYVLVNGQPQKVTRNYARRVHLEATGDNAQFFQTGIHLTQSDAYALIFENMDASSDMEVIVSNADKSVIYYKDTVSADDYIVTKVFAMPLDVSDENAVLTISLKNGASVQLDNIMLKAYTRNNATVEGFVAEAIAADAEPDEKLGWFTCENQGAQVLATPNEEGAYAVNTWKSPKNNYQSMFLHIINNLYAGMEYTLTFEAKSSVPNTNYLVNIQNDNDWSWAMPNSYSFDTTTEWQTYTVQFTSALSVTPTNYPTYLKFLLSDCAEEATLYLRNLSLVADDDLSKGAKASPTGITYQGKTDDGRYKFSLAGVDSNWVKALLSETPVFTSLYNRSHGQNGVAEDGTVKLHSVIMKDETSLYDLFTADSDFIYLAADAVDGPGKYAIQITVNGYNNALVTFTVPEEKPTASPTTTPSTEPEPTTEPTEQPKPTTAPSSSPTAAPSTKPTAAPSANPTSAPSGNPTPTPAPESDKPETGDSGEMLRLITLLVGSATALGVIFLCMLNGKKGKHAR